MPLMSQSATFMVPLSLSFLEEEQRSLRNLIWVFTGDMDDEGRKEKTTENRKENQKNYPKS